MYAKKVNLSAFDCVGADAKADRNSGYKCY